MIYVKRCSFFFKIYLLIYTWLYLVFMAMHALSLLVRTTLVAVLGLLIAVASLIVEHRLQDTQALAVVK